MLHHSKPIKDEVFTQDVYTSKFIESSILTSNEMLMLLYLSIRLKGEEARLSVAYRAFKVIIIKPLALAPCFCCIENLKGDDDDASDEHPHLNKREN